jgi:hypothetical protein
METDTIHVHPAAGVDTNAGAQDSPLRTLGEAARRVNQSAGAGAMTIVLAEGIYALAETILFKPEHRTFSREARLTIRAETLPDDPAWHTGRMPTLIATMPVPTMWNGKVDASGGAADGIMVETSHVSILGLKFLGLPVVESPQPGLIRRLYAISRLRRDLEDLEIGHCLLAGEETTTPLHVGIIAHGNGVDVHHCLFRGLKISVVYWSGGSSGHAMRHCISDSLYGSAIWTCGIADDFVYHNNVVVNGNYVWTYQSGVSAAADARGGGAEQTGSLPAAPQAGNHYKVVASLFARNRTLTGSGTGARLGYADIDSTFLELVETTVSDQSVAMERDQTQRNYLHPVAGSAAAQIGAGLFRNPPDRSDFVA